jgi:hypothetical protein
VLAARTTALIATEVDLTILRHKAWPIREILAQAILSVPPSAFIANLVNNLRYRMCRCSTASLLREPADEQSAELIRARHQLHLVRVYFSCAIDTVVCLTLAKWETVSAQFGSYLI